MFTESALLHLSTRSMINLATKALNSTIVYAGSTFDPRMIAVHARVLGGTGDEKALLKAFGPKGRHPLEFLENGVGHMRTTNLTQCHVNARVQILLNQTAQVLPPNLRLCDDPSREWALYVKALAQHKLEATKQWTSLEVPAELAQAIVRRMELVRTKHAYPHCTRHMYSSLALSGSGGGRND